MSEPRRSWPFRLMTGIYGLLTGLYPVSVRRRCGPDMQLVLQDLAFDAHREGAWTALSFWLRALGDLALESGRARLRQVRQSLARGVLASTVYLRGGFIVELFRQDLRFSWRSLRRNPLFTLTAVLTLALGIGAGSAIFSLLNGVVLAPLPYPQPERIVSLWSTWRDQPKGQLSMAEYLDFRDQAESLEHASIWSRGTVNLTGSDRPERIRVTYITPSLQEVLSIRPHLGRLLPADAGRVMPPADDAQSGSAEGDGEQENVPPDSSRLALMGHSLWLNRFGGDPEIVGTTVRVNGVEVQVEGILSPGFRLPDDIRTASSTQLVMPLRVDESYDRSQRGWHQYSAAARLRAGVSLTQADAEVRRTARRFIQDGLYPEEGLYGAYLSPLKEEVVGRSDEVLGLLLAAVGFLLLIACANVAGLQMARSGVRRMEMDVRSAMGAGRMRLIAQLLNENLLLAVMGGVTGLLLGVVLVELLIHYGPQSLPRLQDAVLDARVVLVTLGVSLLTGILFGLAPALNWSRRTLSLGQDRTSTAGGARQRLRSMVVIAQLALCVVLVAGSGLTLRSLWKLGQVDPGVDPDDLMVFFVGLPQASYPDQEAVERFHREALQRFRSLPSVSHAASFRGLPLTGSIGDWDFEIEGRPVVHGNEPVGDWQVVTPDYFATMGIEMVRGRSFTQADRRNARHVIVVNQALAETYFPDSDPLGQRISMDTRGDDKAWATIVGVAANVRQVGFHQPPNRAFYRPLEQFHEATGLTRQGLWMGVRGEGGAEAVMEPVRRALAEIDSDLPFTAAAPFERFAEGALSVPRFITLLLGLFALSALMLSCVGVYGVLAYSVNQQRREIGIRMALGADARRLLSMVLGRGLRLSGAGVVLGLILALSAGGFMQSLLFQVSANDPLTYAAIIVVLLAAALLSSYLPARRAVKVDPIIALRSE